LQALFPVVILGILLVDFAILCSILLVKWSPLIPHDAGPFLNGGPQFTLLTLVVAIAAYLATLARLLKDRMKSISKKQAEQTLEDQEAKAKSRQAATKITREDLEDLNEHRTNLSRLILAEKFTVISGLLVVFRICVHPFLEGPSLLASSMGVTIKRIDLLDISVLVLLTFSMFFFALLHATQWLRDDSR
jgi:hypothetical protein